MLQDGDPRPAKAAHHIDDIDHDNWKNIPYSVVMTDEDDEEEVATCAVAGCEQEVVAKYGNGTFCFDCFFKAESKKLAKEKQAKKRKRGKTPKGKKKKARFGTTAAAAAATSNDDDQDSD